ncbi:hypothetical protein N7645_15205 [Pseudomonas juntendi]|uniref:hypothetical protein n=1 Tax=Pseudomonas TaxID=286 RepID=UPI0012AE3043|nr:MULTISPECIES: hypothetical protein [Pseudomonas]MDG9918236.1 hypothetical protein [Pseudomonas juntendi]MDH0507684.1 hypothetical protein [Pseudomonas juntendi]MDH1044834.1 hypothetical protein [Pseudomonas juntendi]MRT62351.1 hypothetical protein [Pseudomonas sp. CAH-1]
MSKKTTDAIPDSLMQPVKLEGAGRKASSEVEERKLVEQTTQVVITHRVNDQFRQSMNQIIEDCKTLRLKPVDVVRLEILHFSTLPENEQHQIMMNVYYDDESLKKSATTFGINRFTKEKMDETIAQLQDYSKRVNVRAKIDAAGLLNQSIAYFATLPRAEKIEAIKEVKAKFADMLVYLTPAQAEAALASL